MMRTLSVLLAVWMTLSFDEMHAQSVPAEPEVQPLEYCSIRGFSRYRLLKGKKPTDVLVGVRLVEAEGLGRIRENGFVSVLSGPKLYRFEIGSVASLRSAALMRPDDVIISATLEDGKRYLPRIIFKEGEAFLWIAEEKSGVAVGGPVPTFIAKADLIRTYKRAQHAEEESRRGFFD